MSAYLSVHWKEVKRLMQNNSNDYYLENQGYKKREILGQKSRIHLKTVLYRSEIFTNYCVKDEELSMNTLNFKERIVGLSL